MNLSKRKASHIIHPQPFSLYQFPLILFSMTLAYPTGSAQSPNSSNQPCPLPSISPAHSQPLTAISPAYSRPLTAISPAHSQPLTAQFLPSALPTFSHQPCPLPATDCPLPPISPAHILPSAMPTSSHQPCPLPPISPAHILTSALPISSH